MWASLVVLLPLPWYVDNWGWVPAYYGLGLVFDQLVDGVESMTVKLDLLFVIPQLLAALLVNWLLANVYTRYSVSWPVKIRGSIMGIAVLTCLILLYTFALYRLPFIAPVSMVNFPQLYH
jgi:hypothetical protein